MDPIAHTLFGAALAESGLKNRSRYATATLLIGANLPDIDVVMVDYNVLRPEREPLIARAAAAVARPDPKWGETPCVFVELKAGAQVTEQEIIEHCRGHLARFKVPRAVVFGELPKTSTGKIQKFQLRERAKSSSAIG